MITKREFEVIAGAIAVSRGDADSVQNITGIDLVLDNVSDALAKLNPRFDRQRFAVAGRRRESPAGLDDLEEERDQAQTERDGYESERDDLDTRNDELLEEISEVRQERDNYEEERDQFERNAEEFEQERNEAREERDNYEGEREELISAYDSAFSRLETSQEEQYAGVYAAGVREALRVLREERDKISV